MFEPAGPRGRVILGICVEIACCRVVPVVQISACEALAALKFEAGIISAGFDSPTRFDAITLTKPSDESKLPLFVIIVVEDDWMFVLP